MYHPNLRYFLYARTQMGYENILREGRQIIEMLHYAFTFKGIVSLPDWYMISKDFSSPGNNLWVDNNDDLDRMINDYQADFFITFDNPIPHKLRYTELSIIKHKISFFDNDILKNSSWVKLPIIRLYRYAE